MLRACAQLQRSGGSQEHCQAHSTDSKHSRAAIFLKCLKTQQLAKGGTPGKTAIGGYLSVTFELTEIQTRESRDPG